MDWIEQFVEVTEGTSAPERFRLWSAITAVAGALERRVYARTSLGVLYPNLYVMLVAKPGVGKTEAVRPVEQILTQMSKLFVAPESMTKAALVDTLADSHRQIIPTRPGDELYEYHSLFIAVSELGTLVTAHDLEFLSVVNRVFDNGKSFRERRRHVNNGKEIQIIHPQLNILAGAQPGFLASILPEEAWLMGFTSRFIMIYAEDGPQIDLFGPTMNRDPHYKSLAQQLEPWTDFMGPCVWEDEAVVIMREIGQGQGQNLTPIPDHPKLESYRTRRVQFLIKLSIISTVSRTGTLSIGPLDVTRAKRWLLDAESTMPGIFKGMSIKTDAQVLNEFHIWMWKKWRQDKHPIPQSEIYQFLGERVYSERVAKLVEVAVKGRLMIEKGMDLYQPVPRLDWTTTPSGNA